MKALRRNCERLTCAAPNDPERDRRREKSRRRCRRSALPTPCWDRADRHSSTAQISRMRAQAASVRHNDDEQAHDGPCRNQILAACLPILASHQSPADFRAGVSGFAGLDRVNASRATGKCDLNYGNCPDMINASLTGAASRARCGDNPRAFIRQAMRERNDQKAALHACRIERQIPGSEPRMDKVDCVVVGAGVIGLAVARRLAQAGREVDHAGSGRRHRHRDLVAQQRGDPRRHLLSGRKPDGADVRQRQARALSTIAASTASRIAIAAS